jgi:hypothetical protein
MVVLEFVGEFRVWIFSEDDNSHRHYFYGDNSHPHSEGGRPVDRDRWANRWMIFLLPCWNYYYH